LTNLRERSLIRGSDWKGSRWADDLLE